MPNIDITTTADTSGIDQAGAALDQLNAAAGGAGGGLGGFTAAAGEAGDGASQLDSSVQDVSVSMSHGEGSFRAVRTALNELAKDANSPVGPMSELNDATGGATEAVLKAAPVILHLGEAFGPLGVAAGVGISVMNLLAENSKQVQVPINGAAASLVTMQDGAQGLKPSMDVGINAIGKFIDQAGGADITQKSFNATLKSTQAGADVASGGVTQLYSDYTKYNAELQASTASGITFAGESQLGAKVQEEYAASVQKAGQATSDTTSLMSEFGGATTDAAGGTDAAGASAQTMGSSFASAVGMVAFTQDALGNVSGSASGASSSFGDAGSSASAAGGQFNAASVGAGAMSGGLSAAGDSASGAGGSLNGVSSAAMVASDAFAQTKTGAAELAASQAEVASQAGPMGSALMSVVAALNAETGAAQSAGQALQASQQITGGGMTPATNPNWGTSPMASGTGGIPALATGGVVTGRTLAWLGEDETEYVIPQSQVGSAFSLGLPGGGAGSSGAVNIGPINIYVTGDRNGNLDGQSIVNQIIVPLQQAFLAGRFRGFVPSVT